MKLFSNNVRFCLYAILFAVICLSGSVVFGQQKDKNWEFCSKNNNWGDKSSFSELREQTIPNTSLLDVDGGRNGGIRVVGSDRSDIQIRACIQTWGNTDEEAKAAANNIKIETNPKVEAKTNDSKQSNWGVSYEIFVPRSINLKLITYNGGISIKSVEGNLDFEAHNGGISLSEVGGNVKGRTKNGGVSVKLAGNSWKGSGLDVETTNGGVNLSMPENYAARVEAGTVNGGFRSDINGLNVEKDETRRWNRVSKINTTINGGGAPIRVVTTNGGVNINASNK